MRPAPGGGPPSSLGGRKRWPSQDRRVVARDAFALDFQRSERFGEGFRFEFRASLLQVDDGFRTAENVLSAGDFFEQGLTDLFCGDRSCELGGLGDVGGRGVRDLLLFQALEL